LLSTDAQDDSKQEEKQGGIWSKDILPTSALSTVTVLPGNANGKGRLNTVDLLIKVDCSFKRYTTEYKEANCSNLQPFCKNLLVLRTNSFANLQIF